MTEPTDRDRIVAALYDSRRHGLGSMSEAEAVGHMADAALAALAPAVPARQAPATDGTALRDRIAEALLDHLSRTADIRRDTDGELAFMPVVTDEERMRLTDAIAAVLPAPVDRAAVLREEAALIRTHCPDHLDADSAEGAWMDCHCPVADDMERRAAAASVTEPTPKRARP